MHEVSDMAIRLRNALQVGHPDVEIRNTKLASQIAELLKREGFIKDICCTEEGTNLRVILKYTGKKRKPSITHFQAISKPSLRVYLPAKLLPRVLGGMGVAIVSTSKGILTQLEAQKQGIGGEILCYIW